MAIGLPLQFTRITGLPVAATALIKPVCTDGNSIFVRSPPRKPSKSARRPHFLAFEPGADAADKNHHVGGLGLGDDAVNHLLTGLV